MTEIGTSPLSHDYVGLIYTHPEIAISDTGNFKSIVANSSIRKGELLILEHVLINTRENCHRIINFNEHLYNTYHPRNKSYSESTPEERIPQTIEKVSHNCFNKNGNLLMADFIVKFNHSCTPNACVYIREDYQHEGVNTVFMEVYALIMMNPGNQITISYGPDTGHKRDFVCGCGLRPKRRHRIFDQNAKIVSIMSALNESNVKRLISEYLETPLANRIIFNHCLMNMGIFFNQGHISATNAEGIATINNTIKRIVKVSSETLAEQGIVLDNQNSAAKSHLFLLIMQDILKSTLEGDA